MVQNKGAIATSRILPVRFDCNIKMRHNNNKERTDTLLLTT